MVTLSPAVATLNGFANPTPPMMKSAVTVMTSQPPPPPPSTVLVVDAAAAAMTSSFSALSASSPNSLSSSSNCSSVSAPPSCLPPTGTGGGGLVVVSSTAPSGTPVVAAAGGGSGKDSGWLTLEVCREHVRQRCTRSDTECRFAHPPQHVDIQNGRVVCCFDSIKGRCQRIDPPCKYLHPPQHLKEQLLQNGRNNLIMKNLQQIQRVHQHATVLPTAATTFFPVVNPYLVVNPSSWYGSYYNAGTMQSAIVTPTSGQQNGCISMATPTATVAPPSDQSVHELEPGSATPGVDVTYPNVQSQAGTQYWTLSPSGGVYAANPTPYYSHCSAAALYYQNGSYALPSGAATAMLVPKRAAADAGGAVKNGYAPTAAAVYPCGTAAYQQMAGHMDMQSCYPMAITVPPPVNGFYGC